ncbi:MAG: ATP-dependent Clp protease ATP-binding subunit [bacterium]|nr:ATP-dependent Clp protease ATP-binding subunit [bacterium]MDD5354135.1 ATP-dependent Clp protease ATP-binding subunit [bacterium]MDD5757029.1 ATP-dependent Clp protease ATP-binding subunit [bacterium]
MFNRFTERAQRAIQLAQEEVKRLNHDYLGTEHLLLGLIDLNEGVASLVLANLDLDLSKIRKEVEKIVGAGDTIMLLGEVPFTPRAKKVLQLAVEESQTMGHSRIGTEHILLGLLREGEGIAAKVLATLGIQLDRVREEIINILSDLESQQANVENEEIPQQPKTRNKSTTPTLDQYCRDLTVMAAEGKLDPVIGRRGEIERVIQILARRTKNNPALIGEPGVGKTAIVEGLAEQIINNNVPEALLNKRVLTLDLAGMLAGTKYRGEFEQRLKTIMEEIRRAKNSIILFIDELHTVVGAGAAEGAIDASNILKPALSRGELQCVGATTFDEYRKYIEHDAALERRFQPIVVEPPSVEDTKEILKGLRERYETHHHVKISDEAIDAAAEMADRYIPDRFQPDKAIDLMDEAASRVRLQATMLPPDMRVTEEQIELLDKEKKDATNAQDFETAAKLRDREKELKTKLDKTKKDWSQKRSKKDAVVGEQDIAYIVSKMTNIPVMKITEKEQSKLVHMEQDLRQRVIGQDEALKVIAQAVRRSRTGLKDPRRPIGSFIFLGPTGVGKTELARALAEFLFGNEESVIRVDMSEFMEKFAVSRLIGAPPGYVGYEEGGQLTEQVRRRPYSVVLLDEIEKAHPDVFNILLQVLDEGKLTDNLGHSVNFKNTVIIMTSNLGARLIEKGKAMGFTGEEDGETSYQEMRDTVLEEVKRAFNPEFVNRIDEVIVFKTLKREEMHKIVELMLNKVVERMHEQNIELKIEATVKEFLVEKGFDPKSGARPLRRSIQKYLEDPLAEELLSRTIDSTRPILVAVAAGKITFKQLAHISTS